MHEASFISVVIPTRGRPTLLGKCIDSLLKQDYPHDHWEIIVVEDGSIESRQVVEKRKAIAAVPISYFSIQHSGAAVARNVGFRESQGEIVAYIDDDALAAEGWLQAIQTRLSDERIGGVGGRVSSDYPEDSFRAELSVNGELLWTGTNCQIDTPQPAEFLPGGNFAFRRAALEQTGGFDPNFSRKGAWREDTDICISVARRGYKLIFDSDIKIFHLGARWLHPLERVRPSLVWNMVRDDGYFRAKNFGWRGTLGAAASQVRQAGSRMRLCVANFALVFAHLLAWIPGVVVGLGRRSRTGT